MRFHRPGVEGAERPVVLDEHDRVFDRSPITPDIDGAFLADNGIETACAAQFPLRHNTVTSTLIGARTPGEVGQNAAHLATEIPDALWAEL